jgi:hypothetical protein
MLTSLGKVDKLIIATIKIITITVTIKVIMQVHNIIGMFTYLLMNSFYLLYDVHSYSKYLGILFTCFLPKDSFLLVIEKL